jgi:hypothetical protein
MPRSSTTWTKETAKPGPGRPKYPADLKEACKQLTPVALDCLTYWAKNRKSAAGTRAAEVLLAYGHGAPQRSVKVEGEIKHNHEHFAITASAEWLAGLLGESHAMDTGGVPGETQPLLEQAPSGESGSAS